MVSIKFLQARFPTSTDMLRRVADSSVWIAGQLDFTPEGIKEIEIAALLCYAGKIALPDEYTKIPILIDGMPSHQIMYQLPGTSKEIVSTMRRFKDIATILYHLFENFDGSGFPEKLSKWQIPISSRIIRVALDYEEMRYHTKMRPGQIISDLRKHSNRLYDHRMITLLEQYLASVGADPDVKEKARKFHELREGMVLSRDVYTNSGLKLMTAGTILTTRYIERIQSHNTSDPILGNIIVRVD
jgi:response regulator RpfG family c-di-GMP phosphodiesterase